MPKQIQDIKQFLEICRRTDAKSARIQKSYSKLTQSKQTKFKVRCSRFVYTLAIDDLDKADKIRQSLPPSLKIEDTGAAKKKSKK